MTLSTTDNRRSYTGDGLSLAFAFPYLFLEDSHLQVYLDGVLQSSGYSVSGAGDDAGGAVTFTTAPGSGVLVAIVRVPDLLQTTDLPSNGPFPSQAVERMADKAMMVVQRLGDQIDRSVRAADGDADVSLVLPMATARASKVMAFDALGQPVAIEGTPTVLQTQAAESGGVLEYVTVWIQRERVMPQQFGCVADDGASDQTTLLQKAVSAASARKMPLNLNGRRWKANGGLLIPATGIEWENGEIYMPGVSSGAYGVTTAGAKGTAKTVTGTVTRGDDNLNVTDSSGLIVGEWYVVASNDTWSDDGAGKTVTLAEVVRIRKVAALNVQFYHPVRDTYSTSVKLYPISWVDHAFLTNVELTGGGDGLGQNGASLDWVRDVRVYGSFARSMAQRGFLYNGCPHVDIDGGTPGDGQDSTGLSYGHAITGPTISARARNVRGDSLRHVVSAGGSWGVVRGYRAEGIVGTNMTDATVDAHPAVDDAVFSDIRHDGDIWWDGVTARGNDGCGITSQARSTKIDNYHLSRPGQHGILLQPACKLYQGSVKIGGGEIRDHGSYTLTTGYGVLIQLDYPSNAGLAQVSIDGADIESAQTQANGIGLNADAASLVYANINARVTTPGRSIYALTAGTNSISHMQVLGGYYERTNNAAAESVMLSAAASGKIIYTKIQSAYIKGGKAGLRNNGSNATDYHVESNTFKSYGADGATVNITHNGTTQFVANNET